MTTLAVLPAFAIKAIAKVPVAPFKNCSITSISISLQERRVFSEEAGDDSRPDFDNLHEIATDDLIIPRTLYVFSRPMATELAVLFTTLGLPIGCNTMKRRVAECTTMEATLT